MFVRNLSDLPPMPQRAIIINVSTKMVSTLALLSVIRYARMPVLLLDCESKDGSLEHFYRLMHRYDFDLSAAPLRPHGLTLDWVFAHINAERLLLVDSDLEINDAKIVEFCKEYIDEPTVFGSGFTNGPGWLTDPIFRKTNLEGALFHERPWMPLTFLKAAFVRDALNSGKSFVSFRLDNEYTLLPPFLRHLTQRFLKRGPAKLRRHFHGLKPAVVYYDTGAQIFEYLRYEKCMFFVGLPEPVHPRYVTHLFGVTRNVLNPDDRHGGGGLAKVETYVHDRLRTIYHEKF